MIKKYAPVFLLAVIVLSAAILKVNAEDDAAPMVALCPTPGTSSVSVAIQPFPSKVMAGASLPVVVRISNLKEYPLSKGTLLVKVIDQNLVVFSRSVPVNDILIGPSASKELSFSLEIPSKLPSGTYTIEAIYALSESSMDNTDSVFRSGKANAGTSPLTVESPFSAGFSYIDSRTALATTTLDGSISVLVDAVNPSKEGVSVPLLWKDYYGSAIDEKTILSSAVETVNIPAMSRVRISHDIKVGDYPSYKTVVAMVSDGAWSFATAPVRDAKGGADIYLLGIAPFGIGNQAFACVSNVVAPGTGITLTVTDGSGMTLGSRAFNFATTTDNMEFSLPFDIRGSGDIIVTASTASKDGVKHYSEKVFPCTDLGTCPLNPSGSAGTMPIVGIIALAIGLVGIIVTSCIKKKRCLGAPLS